MHLSFVLNKSFGINKLIQVFFLQPFLEPTSFTTTGTNELPEFRFVGFLPGFLQGHPAIVTIALLP